MVVVVVVANQLAVFLQWSDAVGWVTQRTSSWKNLP